MGGRLQGEGVMGAKSLGMREVHQAEGTVYAKTWRLEREVQFVQWGVKGEARRVRSWPWKGSQEQEL